jgi:hypothetical protein
MCVLYLLFIEKHQIATLEEEKTWKEFMKKDTIHFIFHSFHSSLSFQKFRWHVPTFKGIYNLFAHYVLWNKKTMKTNIPFVFLTISPCCTGRPPRWWGWWRGWRRRRWRRWLKFLCITWTIMFHWWKGSFYVFSSRATFGYLCW